MTKIIAIGDPHFQISNIVDVDIFINKIEELAKREQPDLIVILGDLLHTHERVHTTALNKAYYFVDKMRLISLTYVLVGNHDFIHNQIYLTDDHWMNGMKEWENVVIVDKVKHLEINGDKFTFCPYVYPGRFQEALNTTGDEWKDSSIIFAHQEFAGCKMGPIISVDGDNWPLDYPNVISGHIHSKQTPQKNVYYCGSAMQHAFGESEDNIIPIITKISKQDYKLEEMDLIMPRKKIVYMDVNDIDSYTIPPKESEDTIKLTIDGLYDEFKAFKKTSKYKEITDSGVKVVFKAKKIKKDLNDKLEVQHPENDFRSILNNLVKQEKNSFLTQAYELIVNNKNEDVLIITKMEE